MTQSQSPTSRRRSTPERAGAPAEQNPPTTPAASERASSKRDSASSGRSAKRQRQQSALGRLLDRSPAQKRGLRLSALLAALGVIAGIVPYGLGARVLAGLIDGSLTAERLLALCLAALGFYLLRAVLLTASTLVSHHIAYGILERLRGDLADRLTRVPLGRVVDTPAGQLKKVFMEDIQQCEIPIAHMVPELVGNLFGPFAALVYLVVVDWRLALASLVPIVLGALAMCGAFYKYAERYGRFDAAQKRMNATTVEYIRGIAVIKAFGRSSSSYRRYEDDVRAYRDSVLRWMRQTQGWMAAGFALLPAGLLVLLPVSALLLRSGGVDIATVLLAACLSLGMARPLLSALTLADSTARVDTALREVMDWLDVPELERPTARTELSGRGYLLEDVDFAYHASTGSSTGSAPASEGPQTPEAPDSPDGEAPAPAGTLASGEGNALDHVSLACPENRFVALVGPSGAGKTTLARLMLGFWDPDSGRVSFGGVDLRDIPLDQLVAEVGLVAQDTFLYDASIADNLRVARPEAADEELHDALVAAGCQDFLARLPQGIDTPVGSSGSHLSGGERQRVTLARALLKDAPVVVLDEATAYIDPENEDRIQQALGRLTGGRTLVVIAHRLSTVKGADAIHVLDRGRLVESGTHEQLVDEGGLYASLWRTHVAARAIATGKEIER
ncbi:MAG: ABC transporter ATP-binding protein [Actinomyces sp.]|nr:MAG: ABC transporter ATP-binding protein [Actinomyces sp.]